MMDEGRGLRTNAATEAASIAAEGRALDQGVDVTTMSDEELLAHYGGLCVRIANSLYHSLMLRTASPDDMQADARLGLLEARQRYQPGEVAFSTYAYYRIRGSVMDGLRQAGVLRRRSEARGRLSQSVAAIREAQVTAQSSAAQDRSTMILAQLDSATASSGVAWLIIQDALAQEQATESRNVVTVLLDEELRRILAEEIDRLDDLDRDTIRGLYFEGRTLATMAAKLKMSRSWLCRVHVAALGHLHERLRIRGVV